MAESEPQYFSQKRRLLIGVVTALAIVLLAGGIFSYAGDSSRLIAPSHSTSKTLLYSPDSTRVITLDSADSRPFGTSDTVVHLWDARTGKAITHWGLREDISRITAPVFFVGETNLLAVPIDYSRLNIYESLTGTLRYIEDFRAGYPVVEYLQPSGYSTISPSMGETVFSSDGRYAAYTVITYQTNGFGTRHGNHLYLSEADYHALQMPLNAVFDTKIVVRDVQNNVVRDKILLPSSRHTNFAMLRFLDRTHLAYAELHSGNALISDVATGRRETVPDPLALWRQLLAQPLPPEGKYAIGPVRAPRTADFDLFVREHLIIESRTGGRMRWPLNERLERRIAGPARDLRITADSKYIVLADDHLSLWDVRSGTLVRDITRPPSDPTVPFRNLFSEHIIAPRLPPVTALAISPDSRQVAFVQNNQLRVVAIP